MTSTQIWLAIFGMTFVTAVTRAMFLIGGERTVLPPRVQKMLRYAPAAALAELSKPAGWPADTHLPSAAAALSLVTLQP